MLVYRVKKRKDRETERLRLEAGVRTNIWHHSALTKIDGHCVQVCLAGL